MMTDTQKPAAPASGDVRALRCLHCLDEGMVCEDHPEYPAHVDVEGHREHAPGMPCPACCSPIPEDGTHSIAEAFVPDWQRA